MAPPSTALDALDALAQQLLGCAAPALLDVPLDALAGTLEDEIARDALRGIYEAGEADTLRDLLHDGGLSRWVNETSTPREEQAVRAQIRAWLGAGHFGPDDPSRLARIEPLPDTLEPLLAWARGYHLLGELSRPARELFGEVEGLVGEASVVECALGRATPVPGGRSLLGADRARDLVRAHLIREASATAALVERARLFRTSPASEPLRRLGERLRSLVAGQELTSLHAVAFVPARPVSLDATTGTVRAFFAGADGEAPIRARLFVSGFEQRSIEGDCERCRAQPCLHVRALAARLLDACLLADDRLHGPLVALVREPSWKRFLRAVDADADAEAPKDERVVFRVSLDAQRAAVASLLQKRKSDGTWSEGKLVPTAKLLRSGAITERDRPVLEAMSVSARAPNASSAPADLSLLRSLAEHPRVTLEGSAEPLRVREETLHLALVERPEGLAPQVSLGGAVLPPGDPPPASAHLLRHDRAHGTLVFAPLPRPLRRWIAALADFRGVLPKESFPTLAPALAALRTIARVTAPDSLRGAERPAPSKILLRIEPSFDEGLDVSLGMRALPSGAFFPPGRGPELVHGFEQGAPIFARRDLAVEREAAEAAIRSLDLDAHLRLEPYAYRVESEQVALELLTRIARNAEHVDVEWAEHRPRPQVIATARTKDLRIGFATKGQWFAVHGGAHLPEADLAIGRMLDAARRGDRFVAIRGRDYVELEQDLVDRLRRAQLCVNDSVREPVLAGSATTFFVDALGAAPTAEDDDARAHLERALRSRDPSRGAYELSPALRDVLRDYQRDGVDWLVERSGWAPGVCLADEMGLGKTVQAIALLEVRAALGPAIVVAPTSVVGNWVDELARFAPGLAVRVHRDARGAALPPLGPGEVLVTSYELLLRDRAELSTRSFATLVADEAQRIKNAGTESAKAVASLEARFRVALSGTPVENRLGDLWSLFHLIAPGLLGPWARFRARFAVPIERYQDAERVAVLRALVAPFLLRRTKAEVARELPARTEVVHGIELSRAEQELYDASVRRARAALGKRRDDTARSVQILAELTRLRQLACHPRLVVDDVRLESSKLHALLGLLEDLLPRGHRVLVFSQFTRHLALVEEALVARGITHLGLDGSTPASQRTRLVERFQAGEAQVFLISLKAGGTGLNLTAADYVIHLDPWWNPAAEDQASDRAHRIGQERPLTIVKLVALGTIEEKVLALHGDKRRLAEQVVGDGASPLDVGALEELLDLR